MTVNPRGSKNIRYLSAAVTRHCSTEVHHTGEYLVTLVRRGYRCSEDKFPILSDKITGIFFHAHNTTLPYLKHIMLNSGDGNGLVAIRRHKNGLIRVCRQKRTGKIIEQPAAHHNVIITADYTVGQPRCVAFCFGQTNGSSLFAHAGMLSQLCEFTQTDAGKSSLTYMISPCNIGLLHKPPAQKPTPWYLMNFSMTQEQEQLN